MEVKLEDGVPLPIGYETKRFRRWPIRIMQVGQSFVVADADKASVRAAMCQHKRRHPNTEFISRTQPDGCLRVWRSA